MDEQLSRYLKDLYRRGHEHDVEKSDRLERLRNVEPETAQLLVVLVRALKAKRLLELGTSNGYSTLWLADAARSIDGSVLSIDVDPIRTAQALEHLTHMQLQDYVELRTEDGALTLSHAADASLDMIFLDAERPAYCDYWPDLLRVLRPGGLLVVDNVISHADEVQTFLKLIQDENRVTEVVVPIGAGALLVVRDHR
jgi:predicted O-methyltransferase YrrM